MLADRPAPRPVPGDAEAVEVLTRGELEVVGRLVDASNTTLLASICFDGVEARCVYKPIAGERPLWDFPAQTLGRREVAAYLLSAATGWTLVPPTVLRDGPFGPGSVQWWVDNDNDDAEPGAGLVDVLPPKRVSAPWMRIIDAEDASGAAVVLVHADEPQLRRMALFDVVVNNADRKGGHILTDCEGSVFGVDHGLTFNLEHKVRTVLWGWAGKRIPAELREALSVLLADLENAGTLRRSLLDLITAAEVDRTAERVRTLLSTGRHPQPAQGRPAIPWPAF